MLKTQNRVSLIKVLDPFDKKRILSMSRKYWYSYIGPEGGERSLGNYTLVGTPAPCVEGNLLCAIYAPYAGDLHPSLITENIIQYIGAGKLSGINQPPFGPYFVYMRGN